MHDFNSHRFYSASKFIAILLFSFTFWSCSDSYQNATDPGVSFTDMLGREVIVPENPQKIVALNAGTLRLITWLNATDVICAVEGNESQRSVPYLYAHPELREKPLIGSGNLYDMELLTAAAPDLIISTYLTRAEAEELQARTRVPVVAIDYGNFDDDTATVFKTLHLLGTLLDRTQRAEEVMRFIRRTLKDLYQRTIGVTSELRPRVYAGGIAWRGSHGLTSTEPRFPAFRLVNVDNVAQELPPVWRAGGQTIQNAFIDKEQLILWNPEYIFVDASAATLKLTDEPWIEILDAVEQQKVYSLWPYNWYTTNYSTILVNSYYLGKLLYPEQFADVDPEQKAREIYKMILGADVVDDMQKKFGACCQQIKIEG
jgi:iron complex transport system substrate-binding protein